jgi:ribosomal protein L29
MAKKTETTELRSMQIADLRKEVAAQKRNIAKLSLTIAMQTEKDTSKLRKERKQLARLQTVLTEKSKEQLQIAATESTVTATSKS